MKEIKLFSFSSIMSVYGKWAIYKKSYFLRKSIRLSGFFCNFAAINVFLED